MQTRDSSRTCDSLHQGRKQITLPSSPPSLPQHPLCLHQQYQLQFTTMAAPPVIPLSSKRRLAASHRTPKNRTSPFPQLQVRRMGTRPLHPLHLQLRMQSTGKPGLSDTKLIVCFTDDTVSVLARQSELAWTVCMLIHIRGCCSTLLLPVLQRGACVAQDGQLAGSHIHSLAASESSGVDIHTHRSAAGLLPDQHRGAAQVCPSNLPSIPSQA